jgi:hypothetical protein
LPQGGHLEKNKVVLLLIYNRVMAAEFCPGFSEWRVGVFSGDENSRRQKSLKYCLAMFLQGFMNYF